MTIWFVICSICASKMEPLFYEAPESPLVCYLGHSQELNYCPKETLRKDQVRFTVQHKEKGDNKTLQVYCCPSHCVYLCFQISEDGGKCLSSQLDRPVFLPLGPRGTFHTPLPPITAPEPGQQHPFPTLLVVLVTTRATGLSCTDWRKDSWRHRLHLH